VQISDAGNRANALVVLWMLEEFRADSDVHEGHLRHCSVVEVRVEGGDGFYGCATGCEYLRLTAYITCPHIEGEVIYEWGEFDTLADVLKMLEKTEAL